MTSIRPATPVVLVLLLACATVPARDVAAPPQNAADVLLILPLNLAAPMAQEVTALSPSVWKEIEVYLRARDKRLKTVGLQDARRLWVSSVREVRAADGNDESGFDAAARVLVGKLAQHAEFDAVLAPSLFVREARIDDRTVVWDGVVRELEIETARHASDSVDVGTTLEGVAPAVSLHVVVFDARGEEIQEQIAGIELLVRVRVRRTRSGLPDFDFVTRTDLFEDPVPVQAGIAQALAPFIPLATD